MAGLLDVFGTGGGESLSLLGMTPEDIKRAQADAQAQALYALAGRLFQGGKTGQSIAQGLQMGQQAYQQAMKGQMADRLQMAQLQQMQQQRAEAEAAKRRQMFVEQRIAGAYQPEVTTETPLMDITGQQVMGPNVPQPARLDVQSIAPQLMMLPEGRKALAEFAPTYKEVGGQLYEVPRFGGAPTLVAGTKKRDTVTVGNVVLDKDTMQPLYTAPDKPAGAIQEFLDFQKLPDADKKAYINLLQAKRPASTTTVNVGDKSFASAFGQGVAQSVENTFTAAQGAVNTLARIETLKPLVSDAKVFSGPLSGAQQVAIRIADSFGVAGANQQEKLKNTAVAMQQLAGLELNAAEAMKGQGAITENERSLIKRAAGGDLLTMTAGEVSSLLGALEKTSKFKISAHQRNVDRLRKNPQLSELVQFYEMPTVQETPVTIPADSAAQAAAELARRRRGQ